MLTPAQREEFDERGFVQLAGAFPADAAAAMEDRVWSALDSRFGVSRADRSSWKLPLALELQGLKKHSVFRAIGSPTTVAALDDLLGEDRWRIPTHWGQFLVTFPDENAQAWTVPHRIWHTDWAYAAPPEGPFGAFVFSFISQVATGQGGTLVVEGSPRVIRHFVAGRPQVAKQKMKVTRKVLMNSDPWLKALASEEDDSDRVERFMRLGSRVGDVRVRVVELTGEPGDIVIGHPWLLHSGSPNCGERPRFMRVQRIRTAR